MKAVIVAVAAAGANAHAHQHGNAHPHGLFERQGLSENNVCVPQCETIYYTITGEAWLSTPAAPPPPASSTSSSSSATPTSSLVTSSSALTAITPPAPPAPTHIPKSVPTLGINSFLSEIIINQTTTVCGASNVVVPPSPTSTSTTSSTLIPTPTPTPMPTSTSTSTSTSVIVPLVLPTLPAPSLTLAPASSPSSPSHAPANTQGPHNIGSADHLWAIAYTIFDVNSQCKSRKQVMLDLEGIKNVGFKSVRIYSTECDALVNVGDAASAHGLKIILGVWIGGAGCMNVNPTVDAQISAIKKWARWDLVDVLVVANEALFNGWCTPAQLAGLISTARTELSSAGYQGLITTTDVVSAWLSMDMRPICHVIDVAGCNAHAFFNGAVHPELAGPFVQGQMALVQAVCGLETYVFESGWPHSGSCDGTSCPSVDNQRKAIMSIKKTCGDRVAMFEWDDSMFKNGGIFNVETAFGLKAALLG